MYRWVCLSLRAIYGIAVQAIGILLTRLISTRYFFCALLVSLLIFLLHCFVSLALFHYRFCQMYIIGLVLPLPVCAHSQRKEQQKCHIAFIKIKNKYQ